MNQSVRMAREIPSQKWSKYYSIFSVMLLMTLLIGCKGKEEPVVEETVKPVKIQNNACRFSWQAYRGRKSEWVEPRLSLPTLSALLLLATSVDSV